MTVSGNDGNNNLFGQVRSKLNRLKWVDQTVMRATQMKEPDVESAEKKKQRRKCFRWTAVPCCWSLTSDNAVSAESDAETENWCLKLFKPSKRNGLNRENRYRGLNYRLVPMFLYCFFFKFCIFKITFFFYFYFPLS